jgi:hypothetical protein
VAPPPGPRRSSLPGLAAAGWHWARPAWAGGPASAAAITTAATALSKGPGTSAGGSRVEHDTFGDVAVPSHVLWCVMMSVCDDVSVHTTSPWQTAPRPRAVGTKAAAAAAAAAATAAATAAAQGRADAAGAAQLPDRAASPPGRGCGQVCSP